MSHKNTYTDLPEWLMEQGMPGVVIAAQLYGVLYVLEAYWGRRYTPKHLKVLEGATFDEHSPTWHTIVFTAFIEGSEIKQEIVLDRQRRMIEQATDLTNVNNRFLELPYRHEGSGGLGMLIMGVLPAVATAIAGLPLYIVRRAYLGVVDRQAEARGLSPAQHAFYKTIAPHLEQGVRELLLEGLRKLNDVFLPFPQGLEGGYVELKELFSQADRIEIPTNDPDLPEYHWQLNGRQIAVAQPHRFLDKKSPYSFIIDRKVFRWQTGTPPLTGALIMNLIATYRETRRRPQRSGTS